MDDTVRKQLMTHVEKCVRPVRATNTRKDRMRRELLAHITEVYERESSHIVEPSEAAARAVQRFGDPAVIRGELQSSVPTVERFLCRPIAPDLQDRFARRPGETAWQQTLRRAAVAGLACFAAFVVLTPLPAVEAWAAGNPVDARLLKKCSLLVFMALVGSLGSYAAQLISYWKLSAAVEYGRFSQRSLAVSLAATAGASCFLMLILAACNWTNRVTVFDPTSPWLLGGILLGSAIVFEAVSQLGVVDFIRNEEWESLQLDGR